MLTQIRKIRVTKIYLKEEIKKKKKIKKGFFPVESACFTMNKNLAKSYISWNRRLKKKKKLENGRKLTLSTYNHVGSVHPATT